MFQYAQYHTTLYTHLLLTTLIRLGLTHFEDTKRPLTTDCQCAQVPHTKVAPGADVHQETSSKQHNILMKIFYVSTTKSDNSFNNVSIIITFSAPSER